VLLIDRNFELPSAHRYRARSPGHCLSGMMRKERSDGFNLTGLFRASQHDQDAAEREGRKVPSEPAPLLIANQTNGAFGRSTNDILARIAAHFEGGAA
jgi:hypothetical protein